MKKNVSNNFEIISSLQIRTRSRKSQRELAFHLPFQIITATHSFFAHESGAIGAIAKRPHKNINDMLKSLTTSDPSHSAMSSRNSRFRSFSSSSSSEPKSDSHHHFDQWKKWYERAKISSGTLLDNSDDMDPTLLEFMHQSEPYRECSLRGGSSIIANDRVHKQVKGFKKTRIDL